MRTSVIIFLFYIPTIGYTQTDYDSQIVGSWILVSTEWIHPTICFQGEEPTANKGQKWIFYKNNDFIFFPSKKGQENTINGTWKIKSDNILLINSKEGNLELKIRFYNSRLFLRNTLVELEFERK